MPLALSSANCLVIAVAVDMQFHRHVTWFWMPEARCSRIGCFGAHFLGVLKL